MTRVETGALMIFLVLIIVVAVVLDGGLLAGIAMALAGIVIGFVAVRRRRASGAP